jgi:hypothetical protein
MGIALPRDLAMRGLLAINMAQSAEKLCGKLQHPLNNRFRLQASSQAIGRYSGRCPRSSTNRVRLWRVCFHHQGKTKANTNPPAQTETVLVNALVVKPATSRRIRRPRITIVVLTPSPTRHTPPRVWA